MVIQKIGVEHGLQGKYAEEDRHRQAGRSGGELGQTADGCRHIDKAAARRLLEMGGFPQVVLKERDPELYILEDDDEEKKIIVLDRKPVLAEA